MDRGDTVAVFQGDTTMIEEPLQAEPESDPLTTPAGDPARHLDTATLTRALRALPPAPRHGIVRRLVVRGPEHVRAFPERVALDIGIAVPGDRWNPANKHGDGTQITVMRADVADVFANGQDASLAGDNLMVDLDLASTRLPAGRQLRIGSCTLEVTDVPHTGCKQFTQRFGAEAMNLTAAPEFLHDRLRGLHLRVITPGTVAVGDTIEIIDVAAPISRPAPLV